MTSLVRYEALKSALAEALTIDEVKDIRDKAEAMRAYARMANDEQLELDAAEYRVRAERRLGQLMEDERKAGKLAKGSRGSPVKGARVDSGPTLADRGVDKHLADRARKMSAMPEDIFEAGIQRVRDGIRAGERGLSLNFTPEIGKRNAETRRNLACELSDTTAALSPTGRKFAALYADPAWTRKAGIGNRAYENSYVTMSWDDIIAMPVAQRLLPDAWGFIWVPRAHMLALHPVEIETPLGRTTVKLPLIWAVAHAWGFDAYSTCFIWTKTDESFPDDHGLGLIAWDQDEVLCMFKRGRGLPKPDTEKKHGSNYRERAGRHSAKPPYYRDMINDMTRGETGEAVPVLELFAREDHETPLPPNFFTWGNQSKNTAEIPEPVDSSGHEIPHDPDTGEIHESPPPLIDDTSNILSTPIDSDSKDPPLDIPSFLRRGHVDCVVGKS